MSLHERIAAALGPKWTVRDVQGFSLPTIRELLRGPKHAKLYEEVTRLVASGGHITR